MRITQAECSDSLFGMCMLLAMRRLITISFQRPNKTDLYGEKYGLGIVLAGGNAGIGRYEW